MRVSGLHPDASGRRVDMLKCPHCDTLTELTTLGGLMAQGRYLTSCCLLLVTKDGGRLVRVIP